MTTQLLTPEEAAKLLGVRTSTLAVWRCKRRYRLAYCKIGSKVFYRATDVEKFIESRLVK